MLMLTDPDVEKYGDMGTAISAVEEAMRAKSRSAFLAPPRHRVAFGQTTELIFSVGGSLATADGAVAGVRSYFSRSGMHFPDQVVAVWNMSDGALNGVIVGAALGALRMGAIGGVAIKALANPGAATIAILGAGRQARSHLEAAAVVRKLRSARVFSRDLAKSRAFAELMSQRLGIDVRTASSAEDAVADASIVIGATSSLRPVIKASDLAPGTYVHSVGFKSPVAKEFGLDVADRAEAIYTDSPAQAEAFGRTFILHGTKHFERMIDLAQVVSGIAPAHSDADGIRVSYPLGMTGTDIVVANTVLQRAAASAQSAKP